LKERLFSYLDETKSHYTELYQEIYYIRERCGNWGGVVFNSTWNLKHISPFEDVNALQKILALPKEIRRNTKVQHQILKNHSSYLYFYPINRNPFNNGYLLFIPEKNRVVFKRLYDYGLSIKKRISRKRVQNIALQRSEIFFKHFREAVKPLMIRQDSITNGLLNVEDRDKLIYEYENKKTNAHVISQLYTMELWKEYSDKMKTIVRRTK